MTTENTEYCSKASTLEGFFDPGPPFYLLSQSELVNVS